MLYNWVSIVAVFVGGYFLGYGRGTKVTMNDFEPILEGYKQMVEIYERVVHEYEQKYLSDVKKIVETLNNGHKTN